jgi:HK97 family phage prohead protease
MPIKSDREYRAFEVRAEDEKRVQGYATTFNSAYTLYTDDEFELREIINENAFDECDMTDVIMQYNHEGRVFARNTNGTLKIDIDKPNGLLIDADLGGTQLGSQVYEEIEGKYTNKMSIGFKVDRAADVWTTEQIDGRVIETRQINKIVKLYDVSAVSIPANNQTSIEAISVRALVDGEIEKLKAERLEAERLELEKKRAKLRARFLMED